MGLNGGKKTCASSAMTARNLRSPSGQRYRNILQEQLTKPTPGAIIASVGFVVREARATVVTASAIGVQCGGKFVDSCFTATGQSYFYERNDETNVASSSRPPYKLTIR